MIELSTVAFSELNLHIGRAGRRREAFAQLLVGLVRIWRTNRCRVDLLVADLVSGDSMGMPMLKESLVHMVLE
jgi:hypothetical protein